MKRKLFSDSKARQNTFTRSLRREVFTEIDKNLSSQNQLMTVATILRVGFARFHLPRQSTLLPTCQLEQVHPRVTPPARFRQRWPNRQLQHRHSAGHPRHVPVLKCRNRRRPASL